MYFAAATGLALGEVILGATSSAPDLGPYVSFLNYGILGLLAIGFLRGNIVSDKHYTEMKSDRDQARGELVALRTKLDEQIIPALTRNNDLTARLLERERREDR